MTDVIDGDLYETLTGRALSPRSTWIPSEDNAVLVGQLVAVEHGETDFSGPTRIAVLLTRTGEERAVWLFHHVLRNEFARLQPAIGDHVAIAYRGRRVSEKTGNEFVDYRVVVHPASVQIDWGAQENGVATDASDQVRGATFTDDAEAKHAYPTDDIPF
jgi:hypothetical protein